MINLNLSKLEKGLGLKLKKECYVIGLDLASTTGICIIEINGKVCINLKQFKIPKTETLNEQLEIMLRFIEDLKKEIMKLKPKQKILVIEHSYLGINPQTFALLRMFSGIVFATLFDVVNTILFISPNTSRKNVGLTINPKIPRKEKKQKVIEFVSNILHTKLKSDDEADAVVYALNGIIR